ncbi:PepSY-associated TM helix domain-containing protein [Sphingomonas sp. 37zxx]|uniref:PepSY-associated TM helix domain-containing protein n=1 Tax=Sphingomonas sp. 37zxx TaxID=1550073 RepID=UPI0006897BBC|nr:PepSY-associated TM helix domain-containing protein [Sphingomonas sp. 37zxx]
MSKGFRQSQAWLHTWSGLLLGWLLFVVFLTGSVALWREGMNRWMRPELARVESPMTVLAGAQRFLEGKAPDAKSWFITMPGVSAPGAQLFWVPQPNPNEPPGRRGRRDNQALIGADGEPVTARETRGGEFFYRFHFDLYYLPVIWARWLVGIATFMMLVAILTGVVTHKKIFRDFFTLRRAKGQRSWLDGHNATAVLALPFHLMITYTGLVTLMALLMPWATVANYEDERQFFDSLFPYVEAAERSGTPAPLVDLRTLVGDAERRLGGKAGTVEVSQPNDAVALVSVSRASRSMLNSRAPRITYHGTTGAVVWASPAPGPAAVTAGAMIGLHAGRFADTALRCIYFLCGVAGTLMVASGLVLWTVKRREKLPDPTRPHFGFRLVERLNIAVVGGFPFAVGAMLWANRLLPVAMPERAAWEVHVLFIAWGVATLLALLLKPARGWTGLLAATGVLLGVIPLYNIGFTERGLIASVLADDWLPVGVDLTLLVFAAGYLATARAVSRYRPAGPKPRRSPVPTIMATATVAEPAE